MNERIKRFIGSDANKKISQKFDDLFISVKKNLEALQNMKENEYQCSICKGIFQKVISDDEAMAETKNNFGQNIEQDDCDLVCDPCYNKIITQIQNLNYFILLGYGGDQWKFL